METEGSLPHSQVPPPHVAILSQLDPVHTPISHFLKINLNIILSSTPGSPKWSLSHRFPHQNPVYASSPYVLHDPPISFFSILSPHCVVFSTSLLGPNILLNTTSCNYAAYLNFLWHFRMQMATDCEMQI